MKKIIALASLFALSVSSVAMADGHKDKDHKGERRHEMHQGGFYDESKVVKTVKDALNAEDNTPVLLEGQIVSQIDEDEYTFKDASGETVTVDIDHKAWKGQTINPQDIVKLRGKVDKDWGKVEIEVRDVISNKLPPVEAPKAP